MEITIDELAEALAIPVTKLDPLVILRTAELELKESKIQASFSLFHAQQHLMNHDIRPLQRWTESIVDWDAEEEPLAVPVQLGMLGRQDAPLTRAETRIAEDPVVMVNCCTGDHQHPEDEDADCNCGTAECGCSYNPDDNGLCGECDRCDDCCSCMHCSDCGDTVSDAEKFCTCCDQCITCCQEDAECMYCAHCDRRRSGVGCAYCERCERCCNCWFCDGCGETHDAATQQCDHCSNCLDNCYCVDNGDGERVSRDSLASKWPTLRNAELRFYDSVRTQFKTNTLRRHISAEIEVDMFDGDDPTDLNAAMKKWNDAVVEDGSLNNKHAHEVNTQPTNGDRFLEHIKDITEAYKKLGADCSNACGLHIHVNAKDLTFYDLRKVILLYAKTERALFELVSPQRFNARYSKVCGASYANMSSEPRTFRRQLLGKLYCSDNTKCILMPKAGDTEIKDKRRNKWTTNGMRYRALNLHSYFMRGSIEFRHHEGSVDYAEITNWALICGHLIDTAEHWTEAKIKALPADPQAALLAVIPSNLHDHCLSKWNWRAGQVDANGKALVVTDADGDPIVVSTHAWWDEYITNPGDLPHPPGYEQPDEPTCDCGDPACPGTI